jgi:hypothetical protein
VCCKSKKDCGTCVFNETFNCERYLRVEGQYFQYLLRSVNKGMNFPSFQIGMLSRRQNSRALRGRCCTCRGEAQSRERVKFIKNVLYNELFVFHKRAALAVNSSALDLKIPVATYCGCPRVSVSIV